MTVPAWADLEARFHETRARAPAERGPFLAERCAGRPDLQAQVVAMLHAHDEARSCSSSSKARRLPIALPVVDAALRR